jgi:AbrB family looped-hinge helix DNA binding protein
MSAVTIQIRRKGVITIPIEMRRKYNLGEGDVLTLEDLGEGTFLLLLGPSSVANRGDRVAQMMEEEGVDTETVLQALEEEREAYYRDHYV